jgi:ATP-dependent helicase IRC3
MVLRKYQTEAIEAVKKNRSLGINKQVLVMATASGKTVIFAHLIADLIKETGKKALIIAHREELLEQAKDKLLKVDPTLKVDIEQADKYANNDASVIIASVPTLGRTNTDRISRFNPRDFCIMVSDEFHHSVSPTYQAIFRYFGVLKCESDNNWNKDLLLLGVTATPGRTDNQGLDKIADIVSYEYGIIKGIQDGFLSRIKAFRVNTATDLRGISRVAGDFNQGELSDAVNNEDRNGLIVKAYKTLVPNQKSICFTVDVAHAQEMARVFKGAGVKSDFVVGTTPKDERRDILRRFSNGEIKVLNNVGVLTEGFDSPDTSAILMARPTQSGILFNQMAGRGLRIFPGKEHLTLIDFVDVTARQNLQTTSSILGIPGQLDFKGKDILYVKEDVDKLLELAPGTDLSKIDIDKIRISIEEVDILSGLKVPDEISPMTRYDWHRFGEDCYRVGLANGHTMQVKQTLTGQAELSDIFYDKDTKIVTEKTIGTWGKLEVAVKSADYYIGQTYPESINLIMISSSWRSDKPTDKQIKLLTKLRVGPLVISQMDKGQASRLITKILNQRRR